MIALYVRPQDWVSFFFGWPTAYIIIPLGLIAGYAQYKQDPESYTLPQNKIMLVYLLVIFVSTLINVDFFSAKEEFILFLKRAVVFYMIIWNVNTKEKLYKVIGFMVIMSLFLAYQAILQGTTGHSWGGMTPYPGYEEIRVRWYGDWDGPNVYGILFVMAAAISLELVVGKHGLKYKLMGLASIMAYMSAIFFTNSRGAVLSVACSFIFYFKDKIRNIKALIVGFIIVIVAFSFAPSRMSQVSSGESSAHERTWLWEQGLDMLIENPALGVGRDEFAKRTDLDLIAHNNYVQNFAELGLIGFFLFTALIWFCFKGNYVVTQGGIEIDYGVASVSRMMTAMIVGYCAATFFVVMELDLFYFMLGLAAATHLVARRENPEVLKLELTKRETLTIIGIMVIIITMVWLAAVKEIL